MTICVAVEVRDGVVLGTDSMTRLHIPDEDGTLRVAKTYSNARKVFQVKNLPIGIMSWGAGNIGPRTPYGLVLEFSQRTRRTAVKSLSNALCDFLRKAYDEEFEGRPAEERPRMGFYVAGYSPDEPLAEEWEFEFPSDEKPSQVGAVDKFTVNWRGITRPFVRLLLGFDPTMRAFLKESEVPDEVSKAIFDERKYEASIAYGAMPVQDAINFAVFVLRTTIGFDSFELGPPTCGGPLQVATICQDRGFQWVEEPKFRIEEVGHGF